jgi:acetyl-CoA synthetase
MTNSDTLKAARDFLVAHRDDYDAARAGFRWPRFTHFNFALDWFDVVARERDREALRVVAANGGIESRRYSELSEASDRAANFLRALGVTKGDVILLMLDNVVPLWEAMLAAMKLGAVVVPASTLLSRADLGDRVARAEIRFVITTPELAAQFDGVGGGWTGIVTGAAPAGWRSWDEIRSADRLFTPGAKTAASDPLLLYFTSGTTAKPKLVLHSQVSYPVGSLSTLYWIGLRPGDVHLNISSPGWAKHAWSCFFTPWLAEATVLALGPGRFDPKRTLDILVEQEVTTFCAPPTVWRHLIQHDLTQWPVRLREAVAAGEPLNPEIIAVVEAAWKLPVRDGFGQTESSAMIGNTPGQPIVPGSVGRALPGFELALLDDDDQEVGEGELSVRLGDARPVGLMQGYRIDDVQRPLDGGHYRTGDVVMRDAGDRFTYVGRADDVFKASDYRISPFELESILIEHPAVMEAAVVPSPDPIRLAVPKCFVSVAEGHAPSAALAADILAHARDILGPFKRIRRIQFDQDLPKTISGKIRRVELRRREIDLRASDGRAEHEWFEEDFGPKDKPAS